MSVAVPRFGPFGTRRVCSCVFSYCPVERSGGRTEEEVVRTGTGRSGVGFSETSWSLVGRHDNGHNR